MDDQINYGNKAKNLEFVANHTDIEIPYFRELSLEDLGNINEILNDFSEEIMIRSNSSNEDLESPLMQVNIFPSDQLARKE